ncbi:MAG TPA: SseB family protein [Cellulomonas sp.]
MSAGRALPPTSPFAGDDGRADPGLAAALAAHADGRADVAAVVAALTGTRVLVPVLAELDSAEQVEVGGHAHTVEKEASAGIVALRAPDGRTALPVFSAVAAMSAWRSDARPVPTAVARAALSAVTEGWELLVLDPGGPVTVLLPRPAVWALAQQQVWQPAVTGADEGRAVDPAVRAAVRAVVVRALTTAGGEVLRAVDAVPGRRAEVAVELVLVPGLARGDLDAVLRRVGDALGADDTVTRRVDSIEVRVH